MKITKLRYDGIEYPLNNIVIIIGGNNAGKTKLLQSLYDEVTGLNEVNGVEYGRITYRDNYWPNMFEAGYFEYTDAELKTWVDAQKPWKRQNNQPTNELLYRSRKYIMQMAGNESTAIRETVLADLKANRRSNPPSTELEWVIPFKKSHIQEAGVDQRFSDSNQLSSMSVPQGDEISGVLYTEKYILDAINKHLEKMFEKKLMPIMASATQYALLAVRKNEESMLPLWINSSKPDAIYSMSQVHKRFYEDNHKFYIADQSHGTRAAISLLMSLSDKTRKIIFIDEPELHLYPANRKYIAKLIAESSTERQVFIVTHDPLSIDSISTARKDFTILKASSDHILKVVNFNSSRRRKDASELKSTESIQAGFLDSALFVEGTDDKYLYGSILSRKKLIREDIEFGIVDCGGGDRIAHHIKFARDLGTKVAAIVDFDTLDEIKKDKTWGRVQKIVPLMHAMDLPPTLIAEVVSLRPLLAQNGMLRNGLGATSVPPLLKIRLRQFINDCASYGIFIVPGGEAYSWFNKIKSDGSIEYLRNIYFNHSSKYAPLTNFLKEVSDYLTPGGQ